MKQKLDRDKYSPKVNIMYLIGSLTSGGAEKQLVELARNLDKTKYNVFIVIYRDKIHYKYILRVEGVQVVCIEKKYILSLLFLWRLVRFIKRHRIDIVHSYMYNTNVWARLAGKLSGCKIIIPSIRTINLSVFYHSKWYLIERLLAKWTTRVITNSEAAKQEYLTNINVPSDFVTVLRNGIDLDMITNSPKTSPEELRLKYKIQKDDFVIVHVAGIDRNKNQLCLLKAIESTGIENLKGLFVGRIRDNMYYQELQGYVKRHNLGKSVFFLGEQQDVFSIMNMSDLLVLTSLREAFPNVIIEAMGIGLPVISSDVGDVRYVVKDGKNGYLFPVDDYIKLSELLLKMRSMDPHDRIQMGKFGKRIIATDYEISKMVKKTEEIYNLCLNIK